MRKIIVLFSLTALFLIQPLSAQTSKTTPKVNAFKRFKLDIGAGESALLASTAQATSYLTGMGINAGAAALYYSTLTKGTILDARLHYMYSNRYGLGIAYHINNSQSAIPGYVEVTDNSYNYYGQISESIFTNYIGASFLITEPIVKDGKLSYRLEASAGPLFYRDENLFIISKSVITGISAAVDISGGLQYKLTDNLSLGFRVNLMTSTLTNINVQSVAGETGTNSTVRETLNRINWLAYLAFNL